MAKTGFEWAPQYLVMMLVSEVKGEGNKVLGWKEFIKVDKLPWMCVSRDYVCLPVLLSLPLLEVRGSLARWPGARSSTSVGGIRSVSKSDMQVV